MIWYKFPSGNYVVGFCLIFPGNLLFVRNEIHEPHFDIVGYHPRLISW